MGYKPRANPTAANSHSSTPPTSHGAEQAFVTPNSSFTATGKSLQQEGEDGRSLPSQQQKGEGEDGTSSDEDDKFFEAPEEFVQSEPNASSPPSALEGEGEVEGLSDSTSRHGDCSNSANHSPRSSSGAGHLREGVLHPMKDMLLLATGEQLCVPVTQDPGPLTEDMMAEQEHVLSKLGTSEEAAHIRARLQAASLLSDMQAFKVSTFLHALHIKDLLLVVMVTLCLPCLLWPQAANPGCLLGDFVRWYSPRDWQEERTGSEIVVKETGSGSLFGKEESVASMAAVPTETGTDVTNRGNEQAGSSVEGQPPSGVAGKGESEVVHGESEVGEGDGWEWDVIDDSSEGGEEAEKKEDKGSQTWVRKGEG